MTAKRETVDAPPRPAPPLDDNLHQSSWEAAEADALGRGPGARKAGKEKARPGATDRDDTDGGARRDRPREETSKQGSSPPRPER